MSEYNIGHEVKHKDKTWRIVRIVTVDQTLFEDDSGCYIIMETYLQLKGPEGEIDHLVMDSQKLVYNGPASTIKGLPILPWRHYA